MSTSGGARSGSAVLGVATTSVPMAVDNVSRMVPGLSVPIAAAQLLAVPAIDILVALSWIDSASAAVSVIVAIAEDGVVINESPVAMSNVAGSNFIAVPIGKYSHVPAAGDHTYWAMVNTSAGTARVFGETIAPIVLAQLVVKAA